MIMHGVGLNTTVMRFSGVTNLGIIADRDIVPDDWPLAAALAAAQAELVTEDDQTTPGPTGAL